MNCPKCGSAKTVNSNHEYWCRECYYRFTENEVMS